MSTHDLATFRAVFCSGVLIPDQAAVTALALLFEKVYVPSHISMIREFATRYRFKTPEPAAGYDITGFTISLDQVDELEGLNAEQRETARRYLFWALSFVEHNKPLFTQIFESEVTHGEMKVTHIGKSPAGRRRYHATLSKDITLADDDDFKIAGLIGAGYVPVVGRFPVSRPVSADAATARQLATLLAMKSIELVLPRTKAANPELILEARSRLADQLPQFWSAMLKLSVELRRRIEGGAGNIELHREVDELVDTLVRPSLIDLVQKLEMERKDWFYKILSPVQRGLRLLVGNPPLNQQQLVTSALALASDVTMSAVDNMRVIEALKRESGLTYLLDLSAEMRG